MQETLKEDAIPYMGRLGWTFPMGLIANVVVVGIIGIAIATVSRWEPDEY
jgi:hypothetical protein